MIKDFLIINFTGKNDSIGLRVNNNFFVKKLQTNIRNNGSLVKNIFLFIKEKKANLDKNFSVIVNIGPGSFSGIRISLAVAKGLEISKKVQLYGYNNEDLREFNQENINKLLKSKLSEKKLIKPIYLS